MSERGSKPPNDFEAPQAPLLFGEERACWRVQPARDQRNQHHCLCTKLSACPAIPRVVMPEPSLALCPGITGDGAQRVAH